MKTQQEFHVSSNLEIREHPNWKEKHLLGPVTFDYRCPYCKKILAEDTDCKHETEVRLRKEHPCWFSYEKL